jgi:NAD+ diphosphatase
VRHYLFSGQDIFVSSASGPWLDEDPPSELVSGALLRREYDELGSEAAGDAEGARSRAYMLGESGAEAALALGFKRMTIREALAAYDEGAVRGALRGIALLRALESTRFCPACGASLAEAAIDAPGPEASGIACPACGRVHFPRISPAVIVLIRKGPRALVAHNARFPKGRFGLIAGFVEAGETLEEAAIRESREEAGIEIGDLRYVKSQSWPFPDSLMVAFTASWVSGEARPDGVEIEELRWCLSGELPDIPPKGSVARFLLDGFSAGSR